MPIFKKRTNPRKVKANTLSIRFNLKDREVFLYVGRKRVGSYIYSFMTNNRMYVSDFGIHPLSRDKGYGSFLARSIPLLARLYHCKSVALTDGATLDGFWQYLGYKKATLDMGTVRLCL